MKHHYLFSKAATRFFILLAAACCTLSTSLYAQMPPNIDFSSGNFNNWICWTGTSVTGTSTTGAAFSSGAVSGPIGGSAPGSSASTPRSRHAITNGSDTDYYGGFPIVSPLGGLYSMRIGNDLVGAEAERIQYRIHVPATSTGFNLQCQYAVVFEDPGHDTADQPTFRVVAYDSATGAVVPAANNLYISGYAVPGFFTSTVANKPLCLPWTTTTINLSGMAGQTIILEVTNLDCTPAGHFGYGYFDVISASDSLAASLLMYNALGDSVTLQGPAGYKYYEWYNQDFSQALSAPNDTARTKTFAAPSKAEYYNLIIKPYAAIGVPDTIRSPMLKPYNPNLGISSSAAAAIANVYPNPAASNMHVSFPALFSGSVSLVNTAGQTVYTKQLMKTLQLDIPTAALAAGTYMLVVKDEQGEKSGVRTVSITH